MATTRRPGGDASVIRLEGLTKRFGSCSACADRVTIIRSGRTLKTGSLADLRRDTRVAVHALTEGEPTFGQHTSTPSSLDELFLQSYSASPASHSTPHDAGRTGQRAAHRRCGDGRTGRPRSGRRCARRNLARRFPQARHPSPASAYSNR